MTVPQAEHWFARHAGASMAYFVTLFEQIDELLCALFGGRPDTTISLTAAQAEVKGKRWGCWLCWWLHMTLRQRHCTRTLAGESMSGFAQVSAAVQLAIVFALIFYGVPWLIGCAL